MSLQMAIANVEIINIEYNKLCSDWLNFGVVHWSKPPIFLTKSKIISS